MRRRKGGIWFSPDVLLPPARAHAPLIDGDIYDFWALHTEQGSFRILRFATLACAPGFCAMTASHALRFGTQVEWRAMLLPLLAFLLSGLLWCNIQRVQRLVERWPVVFGSAIQITSDMVTMSLVVLFPLTFSNSLLQHRVFLSSYFPWLFGSISMCYVPWPVFLFLTCPIHLSGWFIFHHLVSFQPPSCHACGIITTATAAYLYYLRSTSLWQAFDANKSLVKERHLLRNMQDSFRGILSSIFDASCTCDSNGRLLECSPHLQEILDYSPRPSECGLANSLIGLNLCSFLASELESQRLKEFLKNAMDTARHQAAKIQCSFSRKPDGLFEACLYAIVLPTTKLSGNQPTALFISMSLQSTIPDICRRVAEQEIQSSEQEIAASVQSLAVSRDDLAAPRDELAEIRVSESLAVENQCFSEDMHLPKDPLQGRCFTSMSDAVSLASAADHIDKVTLASFNLSDSIPSSVQYQSTSRLQTTCSVEIQTIAPNFTVDAEVQTVGSAARPPVSNRDAHLRQKRRVSSGKRKILMDAFKATPRKSVETVIFLHIVEYLNPKCSPGCCMLHRTLIFLCVTITSMLKSSPCASWLVNDFVQCSECLCLQDRDAEAQFECRICGGSQCNEPLNSNSSSSNAEAVTDDEDYTMDSE